MITKTCNNQLGLEFQSTCLRFSVRREESDIQTKAAGQPILFLFICRWTCSRCWKAAMKIGRFSQELQKRDVAVVMVGGNDYLQQATHLAASLKLPVTLLGDDNNALRKAYGLQIGDKRCGKHALLLLDRNGWIRHYQSDSVSPPTLNMADIVSALDESPMKTFLGKKRLAS